MITTTSATTSELRQIVNDFRSCVIGDGCFNYEEEKRVNESTDKAIALIDAWDRTVEEIMTMLADVPGDDVLSKVIRLKEWYQTLYHEGAVIIKNEEMRSALALVKKYMQEEVDQVGVGLLTPENRTIWDTVNAALTS